MPQLADFFFFLEASYTYYSFALFMPVNTILSVNYIVNGTGQKVL